MRKMSPPQTGLRQWVAEDFSFLKDLDDRARFHIRRDDNCLILDFRTAQDHYMLFANEPSPDDPEGTLSCLGEIYDFTDGPYTRETWRAILADIVGNEILPLREPVKAEGEALII